MKVSAFKTLLWIFVVTLHLPHGAQSKCKRIHYLKDEEKKLITRLHNKWRNDVALGKVENQPPAANMLKMWWNEELAEDAQIWASRCKFEHTSDANYAGENLAMGSSRMTIDRYPLMWYNEHPKFKNDVTKGYDFGNGEYGHYSQVVWATTSAVGCGRSDLMWEKQDSSLVVCRYRPPGNFINGSMYLVGPARSECPGNAQGKDEEFPGLCVGPEEPSGDPNKPSRHPQPNCFTFTTFLFYFSFFYLFQFLFHLI